MGKKDKEMNVKISDDALRGNYSNGIHIGFSNQEFSLDFINNIPPQPIVTSRIITNPPHYKAMVGALIEALKGYEEIHGEIQLAPLQNVDRVVN